jgi:leucyl-tRNA synthetase
MAPAPPGSTPYDPHAAETKWQARWDEARVFAARNDDPRPKYYVLDMFPYPSGAGLHVGHPEGYTATDVVARYKRMRGFNVLHPMGWDAFGLPAENYAIKTGVHPRETTRKAIANFKRQIRSLGFGLDWDREVDTTDPSYYRWTQWIFLQLYHKGLAYEAVVPINWCPSCRTGLANEEVKQGTCERCGSVVEKRDLRQWMLRITAYADRLLADLDTLDWPASTLAMQRNWIGRSEGAEALFRVENPAAGAGQDIRVFTTRPDTLFGATYVVLAPEHPLVDAVTTPAQRPAVDAYREAARKKSDFERGELAKEKTGVPTGGTAINPATGKPVPIWVADYVLWGYGTGAIMAVPAHDQRDYEFAVKFGLPHPRVVRPLHGSAPDGEAFTDEGVAVDSGDFTGLPTADAKKKITAWLETRDLGKATVSYKLRDWIFARQRYWGEPIPIVHCPTDGAVPVPEADLPVRLPDVEKYEPTGTGESPLAAITSWVNAPCPRCGGPAKRETNTMPQWAGSCWYYLRYLDSKNDKEPFSPDAERYWMPVDLYVGGAEHAVLHLLYARFWHKVLFDLGHVHTSEPFQSLRHQGMVLSFAYTDAKGSYYGHDEVELRDGEPLARATGEKLKQSVEKMSKSLKNVINPDEVVARYGADVMRLYEMFMGDFELPKPWDTRAIEGVARFCQRLWRVVDEVAQGKTVGGDPHERLRHKTVRAVTERIESMKFNTAISAAMEYLNTLTSQGATQRDAEALVLLSAPFAPHLGEEAWERLGHKDLVATATWPAFEMALTIDDTVTIAVQVNGKLRGTISAPRGASDDTLRHDALGLETVSRLTQGKELARVIIVKDKLVNLVVR